MYGTIAKMRLKPGAEAQMMEMSKSFETLNIPGYVGMYVYRMDADANDFILTAIFESKEAYFANANSPAQNERYLKMLEMLDGEPQWNDGEIVYAFQAAAARA